MTDEKTFDDTRTQAAAVRKSLDAARAELGKMPLSVGTIVGRGMLFVASLWMSGAKLTETKAGGSNK
jgi:hypothetical protein